jgi:transcriptional regulator with XRE-family HTH domain
VGTSEGQWRRWESGRHVPRPDALARIATEFGIPLGEFFTEPNGKATSEDRLAAVQSALEDVSEALRALQLSHQELANKLVRN